MGKHILLITGDHEVEKYVFQKYGFAYWSSQADMLLEKYGYLSFDKATQHILSEPANLASYQLIIVAWLPEEFWPQDATTHLKSLNKPVILEGPFPQHNFFPVAHPAQTSQNLLLSSPDLGIHAPLEITAHQLTTRPIPVTTDHFISEDVFLQNIGRGLIRLTLPLLQRFRNQQCFYPDQDLDDLAALFLMRLQNVSALVPLMDPLRETLSEWQQNHPKSRQEKLEKKYQKLRKKHKLHRITEQDFAPPYAHFQKMPIWKLLSHCAEAWQNASLEAAQNLMATILQDAMHVDTYQISNGHLDHGSFISTETICSVPYLSLALLQAFETCLQHGTSGTFHIQNGGPIDSELQKSWLTPPLFKQDLSNETHDILATNSNEQTALITQQGKIIYCGFPLLSLAVYGHTLPPLTQHFHSCPVSDYITLSQLLCQLIDRQAPELPTIAPWPDMADYALTIRHDYDRPVSDADFKTLFDFELQHKLGVSWYWIHNRIHTEQIKALKADQHEHALHALRHAHKKEEIADIPCQIHGETWHGAGSDYWNSIHSWHAAKDAGLSYSEFMPAAWDLPLHKYPSLNPDGTINAHEGLIGISFNATTDAHPDSKYKVTRDAEIATSQESLNQRAQNGDYICLLNHPDINFSTLKSMIEHLPSKYVAKHMTQKSVADWWQKTHSQNQISLDTEYFKTKITITITAENDVSGLTLCCKGKIKSTTCLQTNKPLQTKKTRSETRILIPELIANTAYRIAIDISV